MHPNNLSILQEVNGSGAWFAAHKVVPVWVRRVVVPETVSSLEGELLAKPGDFVCLGVAGEHWVQTEATLRAKYGESGRSSLDERGVEWTEFVPLPEGAGVMAARVHHDFVVHTSWGVLSGKPGDYLLKKLGDREVEFPGDIWVVDQTLFETSYQSLEDRRDVSQG
ncbi:MAG: PGDYG domain-containing protein [Verrucomicrobia bacterium]|nr:PGDYG domain-containing protein [Verrucomicrobiota bacterium]